MAGRKKKVSEKDELLAKIADKLGVSAGEAELRALRELAATLGLTGKITDAAPGSNRKQAPVSGALPQRLFLVMDGRMPLEVIDLPTTIGSGKKCTVWINSPQIETRHAMITHDDGGWLFEDLGSEHGTFFEDRKIQRRILQDGDELRLAGYFRVRAELR